MILYQWRGTERNFGDELNSLLWPRLLPDFFDLNEDTVFLGIGSILDNRHDAGVVKLVAGAGYGGYQPRIVLDASWIVHWVRGKRTARLLGLPDAVGIGDPASLLPLAGLAALVDDSSTSPSPASLHGSTVPSSSAQCGSADPPVEPGDDVDDVDVATMSSPEASDIGFIPHFESLNRGAWREVAALAGVTLIDPRDAPLAVLAAISGCRVIISEALHGIIVADALRVPWIAIRPLAPIHRPKWFDWAETLDVDIAFNTLPPSTALEQAYLTGLARFHTVRGILDGHAARLRRFARGRYVDRAAQALRAIAEAEPRLSRDALLDEAQTRMMEAIAALRRSPKRESWRPCNVARIPPTTACPAGVSSENPAR